MTDAIAIALRQVHIALDQLYAAALDAENDTLALATIDADEKLRHAANP